MSHTPGPYFVEHRGDGFLPNITAGQERGLVIAQAIRFAMNRGEPEANAERIALTLNCHDDLLAACEGMLRHIDDVGDDQDLLARRAALVAAIQKAKGGQP